MIKNSEAVADLLSDIVRQARTGDYGAVSSLLNLSIQRIQVELARGDTSPAVVGQAADFLEHMFAAQKRGDWVDFADIIRVFFP